MLSVFSNVTLDTTAVTSVCEGIKLLVKNGETGYVQDGDEKLCLVVGASNPVRIKVFDADVANDLDLPFGIDLDLTEVKGNSQRVCSNIKADGDIVFGNISIS